MPNLNSFNLKCYWICNLNLLSVFLFQPPTFKRRGRGAHKHELCCWGAHYERGEQQARGQARYHQGWALFPGQSGDSGYNEHPQTSAVRRRVYRQSTLFGVHQHTLFCNLKAFGGRTGSTPYTWATRTRDGGNARRLRLWHAPSVPKFIGRKPGKVQAYFESKTPN